MIYKKFPTSFYAYFRIMNILERGATVHLKFDPKSFMHSFHYKERSIFWRSKFRHGMVLMYTTIYHGFKVGWFQTVTISLTKPCLEL